MQFSSNNKTYNTYQTLDLYWNACTDINTYASYSDLGITSSWYYSISVNVNPENSSWNYYNSSSASYSDSIYVNY